MSSTDEQMAERRRKNFAVRAEAAHHPEFDGEKAIYITYNGFQENPINLAPHEARKLYDLLGAEFGFSTPTKADVDALKLYGPHAGGMVHGHGRFALIDDVYSLIPISRARLA